MSISTFISFGGVLSLMCMPTTVNNKIPSYKTLKSIKQNNGGIDPNDVIGQFNKYVSDYGSENIENYTNLLTNGSDISAIQTVFGKSDSVNWVGPIPSWNNFAFSYDNPYSLNVSYRLSSAPYQIFSSSNDILNNISIKQLDANGKEFTPNGWSGIWNRGWGWHNMSNPDESGGVPELKQNKWYWDWRMKYAQSATVQDNGDNYTLNMNNVEKYTCGYKSEWTIGLATAEENSGDYGSTHDTDWNITSQISNQDNLKNLRFLKYNPATFIQLDNVGYDKTQNKYFTQSNLNKELITGALGTKYEYDCLNALDKNGNTSPSKHGYGNNAPLLERDLSGLSTMPDGKDNPSTALYLANTYYYGKTLGMDNVKGGYDIWAPIGDTGEKDKDGNEITGLNMTTYPTYDNGNYQGNIDTLRTLLWNLSNDTAGKQFAFKFSYDNYLKVRDWVRGYITTYHEFPNLGNYDSANPNNLAYQIVSGNIANNGWYEKATKYGINPIDSQALDDLSIEIPALGYNEWNMEDTTGSSNWTNTNQNQYLGPQVAPDGTNYSKYSDIIQGDDKVIYNIVPSDSSTPINIIMNSKACIGSTPPQSSLKAQPASNYPNDDDSTYNVGNINNVDVLAAKTGGAIHSEPMTFVNSYGTKTTDGISIAQSGQIIRRTDDSQIKDKVQVMIKSYVDAPSFYDTKTPNPTFDKGKYENDKYDPDNQPYALLPAGTIYNSLKDKKNDASISSILKQMFYDHKNNNEPALEFANVNLYDDDSFDYNVPADQIDVTIDNASGALTTQLYAPGVDHTTAQPIDGYTTYGFENSTDPFIPTPDKIGTKLVGIIIGSCIGGLVLILAVWLLIANRRRGVKGINPDVKKYRKAGEFED